MYQEVWSAHLLPDDQSTERSTTKSIFLWYRFQRDVHLFLKLRMTFTLTKYLEKSPSRNRDLPFTVGNELLTYAHLSRWSIDPPPPPPPLPRHRTLFWPALVIPDQWVPCCFSSASVSRLQLLRGRPLFLFPCGFQVRGALPSPSNASECKAVT